MQCDPCDVDYQHNLLCIYTVIVCYSYIISYIRLCFFTIFAHGWQIVPINRWDFSFDSDSWCLETLFAATEDQKSHLHSCSQERNATYKVDLCFLKQTLTVLRHWRVKTFAGWLIRCRSWMFILPFPWKSIGTDDKIHDLRKRVVDHIPTKTPLAFF